eukprot:GHVQ01024049.1.p1 GENE.GHVQ01024049.1~~GHVQ01024049.1.p1  ORF type:complete len:736 (+),score=66.72 GHVQ01024049.1:1815-4022(+)
MWFNTPFIGTGQCLTPPACFISANPSHGGHNDCCLHQAPQCSHNRLPCDMPTSTSLYCRNSKDSFPHSRFPSKMNHLDCSCQCQGCPPKSFLKHQEAQGSNLEVCSVCGKVFVNMYFLKKHIAKRHAAPPQWSRQPDSKTGRCPSTLVTSKRPEVQLELMPPDHCTKQPNLQTTMPEAHSGSMHTDSSTVERKLGELEGKLSAAMDRLSDIQSQHPMHRSVEESSQTAPDNSSSMRIRDERLPQVELKQQVRAVNRVIDIAPKPSRRQSNATRIEDALHVLLDHFHRELTYKTQLNDVLAPDHKVIRQASRREANDNILDETRACRQIVDDTLNLSPSFQSLTRFFDSSFVRRDYSGMSHSDDRSDGQVLRDGDCGSPATSTQYKDEGFREHFPTSHSTNNPEYRRSNTPTFNAGGCNVFQDDNQHSIVPLWKRITRKFSKSFPNTPPTQGLHEVTSQQWHSDVNDNSKELSSATQWIKDTGRSFEPSLSPQCAASETSYENARFGYPVETSPPPTFAQVPTTVTPQTYNRFDQTIPATSHGDPAFQYQPFLTSEQNQAISQNYGNTAQAASAATGPEILIHGPGSRASLLQGDSEFTRSVSSLLDSARCHPQDIQRDSQNGRKEDRLSDATLASPIFGQQEQAAPLEEEVYSPELVSEERRLSEHENSTPQQDTSNDSEYTTRMDQPQNSLQAEDGNLTLPTGQMQESPYITESECTGQAPGYWTDKWEVEDMD